MPQRRAKSHVPFDLVSLRERLGVSKSTIYLWQRGAIRPPAGVLLQIAAILNIPLSEVVKIFWKENLGAPGRCGCGITRFPDDPNARTLVIEIPCAQCGDKGKRITKAGAHVNHRELCKRCAHLAEKIRCICIGYPDHDATRWTCSRETWKTREQVSRLQWQKVNRNGKSSFALSSDRSSVMYQCRGCRGAYEMQVKGMEKRFRNFQAQKHPNLNTKLLGRIRSREMRLKRLREYSREMNPNFFKPVPRRARERDKQRSARVSPARIMGGLVKDWGKKNLPNNAHLAFCRGCGYLQKTEGKVPDFHRRCYSKWFDTPEAKNFLSLIRRGQEASLPPYPSRQGRPVTNENLKRFYSWAILYCSGKKSCRQIATENDEDSTFVSRRIAYIINKLPKDPELVTPRWWRQITCLRSAYTKISSEKQIKALAV